MKSLIEAKSEVALLKGPLARAKSEVSRIKASLNNAEGKATRLKEEMTRMQGLLTKVEEKAFLSKCQVLEVAIKVIKAFLKGEDFLKNY